MLLFAFLCFFMDLCCVCLLVFEFGFWTNNIYIFSFLRLFMVFKIFLYICLFIGLYCLFAFDLLDYSLNFIYICFFGFYVFVPCFCFSLLAGWCRVLCCSVVCLPLLAVALVLPWMCFFLFVGLSPLAFWLFNEVIFSKKKKIIEVLYFYCLFAFSFPA